MKLIDKIYWNLLEISACPKRDQSETQLALRRPTIGWNYIFIFLHLEGKCKD